MNAFSFKNISSTLGQIAIATAVAVPSAFAARDAVAEDIVLRSYGNDVEVRCPRNAPPVCIAANPCDQNALYTLCQGAWQGLTPRGYTRQIEESRYAAQPQAPNYVAAPNQPYRGDMQGQDFTLYNRYTGAEIPCPGDQVSSCLPVGSYNCMPEDPTYKVCYDARRGKIQPGFEIAPMDGAVVIVPQRPYYPAPRAPGRMVPCMDRYGHQAWCPAP